MTVRASCEDCVCGHHVSFHEHPFARGARNCWHGRDKGILAAIDAAKFADALGLSEEDRVDLIENAKRVRGCSCAQFHAAVVTRLAGQTPVEGREGR